MKRAVLDTNIIISSALGGALVLIKEFRTIPVLSGREFMDWLQESVD